jgi:hypothetical protein
MLCTHLSSEACPVGPLEAQYKGIQSYSTSVGVMKWCNVLNLAKVMEHECATIALRQYSCYMKSVMKKKISVLVLKLVMMEINVILVVTST